MHVRFTVTVAAALIVATHPHGTAASTDCSTAAVRQAAAQAGVANPDFPSEVIGGVCGEFLGSGSRAMGVVLRAQQCAPNRIWTVLSFTDGAWHHVTGPWDRGPRIDGLEQAGNDIREEQPVFRRADNGCLATGGSRARLWHWDGTRLKAGAFHRAQRPDSRPRAFRGFGGALAATTLTCEFAGRGFALSAAGRLRILIPPPVEG